MRAGVALRLGRVSNLPTVTSNVLAALALAGRPVTLAHVVILCVALSLFYVGGMWLNDAFDRDLDRVERPERPIPSGQTDAATVFAWGFAMLGAGVGMIAALALGGGHVEAVLSSLGLAFVIVYYDMHHKGVPWSPLIMGLCRAGVYTTAALSVRGDLCVEVLIGAGALVAYLIGLTYVAKQENLRELGNLWPLGFLGAALIAAWPRGELAFAIHVALIGWVVRALWLLRARRIKDAVVSLIAGIALLDALWIASCGHTGVAAVAIGCFALTTILQRVVPGT